MSPLSLPMRANVLDKCSGQSARIASDDAIHPGLT
jgi:hypothetical protein